MKHFRIQQKGNALIITMLFFVAISLSVGMGMVLPVVKSHTDAEHELHTKRSYFASESGVEDIVYRLKRSMTVSSTETITLGSEQATTSVTDISSSKKQVTALGNSDGRNRTVSAVVEQGAGVSFTYGMQSGIGGIVFANNSQVNGSVYSNGSITGSGTITGSATSANSASLYADQQNGTGTPSNNITFGDTTATADVAQSFVLSADEPINKVQLYLKKVSTPSNVTVRIVSDNNGVPSNTTLASGTLSASTVTTAYSWIDVTFSSTPQLIVGTTYWIVLDGSVSSTKYYIIGGDSGYTSGIAKMGQYGGSWTNTSPSGLDTYFKVYLGGAVGLISGMAVGSGGVGNAYANTINSSTIAGTNYCKTGSGNNKSCNTSLADPVAIDMPVSDANITDWQDAAVAGGTYTGNYTVSGTTNTLGPKKIVGDLSISNNGRLNLSGTVWVTGNVDISNNATLALSSSYGTGSGILVADGTISIGNNANFYGSGTSGSYIMVLSTSTSTSAITLSNNAGAVVLYAANGTVNVSNNAGAAAINGYKISLGNNAVITYLTGLANANFVNGPSGSWSVTSWKEQ